MTCLQSILFFTIKASKITFLNKLSQLFSQGISCDIRVLLTATLVAILHISRSVWAISGDMGIATQPLTNGSADYPWLIEDRADFEAFSANPAYWATGVNTKLMCDLDLSDAVYTRAVIGPAWSPFNGIFDGNDHTLSNLTLNLPSKDNVGLFGIIDSGGLVKNLSVENAIVVGYHYFGGVGGLVGSNWGTITACHVSSSVTGKGRYGGVGGLAGINNGGITACHTASSITGNWSDSLGGLAGLNNSGAIIKYCYSTGSVTYGANADDGSGGLVGENDGGMIESCYSSCSVHGADDTGGLVGWNNSGTIKLCYATGPVTGTDRDTGGLVGENDEGSISFCYATGTVNGIRNLGGLVAYNGVWGFENGIKKLIHKPSLVKNSFWDKQASKVPYSSGAIGKTTAPMKALSTFIAAGWDFSSADGDAADWQMRPLDYPRLAWELISPVVKFVTFDVMAGKTRGLDTLSFSGYLNASAAELSNANHIIIRMNSADMPQPFEVEFPIDNTSFKNGTFTGKISSGSFVLDTKTGKMTFSAKNLDLTGLACPVAIAITIGDYAAQIEVNETVLNGKKNCPPQLIMGLANSLTVDKPLFIPGKLVGQDTFSASGIFTIGGTPLPNSLFAVTLGTQSFEVEYRWFTFNVKTNVYTCTNAPANGTDALVSAKIDFNKCSYTVSIKNVCIEAEGMSNFSLSVFGFILSSFAQVDLGTNHLVSIENDFRHFNVPGTRTYSPGGYTIATETSNPYYTSTLNSEDTLYWFTDNSGTYAKRMDMAGEFYHCDIITDVLTNPSMIRNGQTFSSSSSFTGYLNVWIPNAPSIDVTISNFAGNIKVTTKTLGLQKVTVPAGIFNAYKIEQTFEVSGTMDVKIYDNIDDAWMDTTGTFLGIYKITYWCDPTIGAVKLIDSGSEKITAKGAGSLSDSWNQTKLLQ